MTKIIVYNMEYGTNVSSFLGYLNPLNHVVEDKSLMNKLIIDLQVYNPDVLGILEIDHGSMRAKLKSQIIRLAHHMQFDELHYSCKYKKLIHRSIPILRKQFNAILGNNKFKTKGTYFLKKGMKRAVLHAEDKNYHYLAVHLSLNKKTRSHQMKELAELINSKKKKVILMGDFNCEPSSSEMRHLLENTNLKITNDFPTFPQWKPSKKLDYILIDSSLEVLESEVLKIPHSDHLPLYINIRDPSKK